MTAVVSIQPIRHLVLELAGKRIRGEAWTESESNMFDAFRQAFPAIKNPIHIYCTTDNHRSYGILLYDESETLEPGWAIQRTDGAWFCTMCGNGASVRVDTIRLR